MEYFDYGGEDERTPGKAHIRQKQIYGAFSRPGHY